MAHTISISDGTTTANLLKPDDYKLLVEGGGWRPQRAQRRQSGLGGSPYADVVETMALEIKGTSESDVLANLGILSDLLDQAEAWGRGEDVTAVYIEYEPDGSALADGVRAVITGPPPFGSFLTMPSNFAIVYRDGRFRIGDNSNPVTLSFTRRGLWLGATETETASTSTGNPAILTTTIFTDTASILMPYNAYLDFELSASAKEPIANEMYFCFTDAANKLQIEEGEGRDGDTGSPSTTVQTDSSAGNVLRWGSGNAGGTATWNDPFNSFNSDIRQIMLIAVMRNQTAGTTADVSWTYGPTTAIANSTRSHVLDGDVTTGIVIKTWHIALAQAASEYYLSFVVSKSSTSVFDLDYWAAVGLDDSTNILRIPYYSATASNGNRIHIEHRLDSNLDPQLYGDNEGTGTKLHQSYDGSAILTGQSNVVSCLVLGAQPPASGVNDNYVIYQAGELDVTLSATRTLGYLTPL
jgi:hypothetical protein